MKLAQLNEDLIRVFGQYGRAEANLCVTGGPVGIAHTDTNVTVHTLYPITLTVDTFVIVENFGTEEDPAWFIVQAPK